MSADQTVTVTITLEGRVVGVIDLTPKEAFDFLLSPAVEALDDGEASWEAQEQEGGAERLDEIASFVNGASDDIIRAIEEKNRAERDWSKPYSQ